MRQYAVGCKKLSDGVAKLLVPGKPRPGHTPQPLLQGHALSARQEHGLQDRPQGRREHHRARLPATLPAVGAAPRGLYARTPPWPTARTARACESAAPRPGGPGARKGEPLSHPAHGRDPPRCAHPGVRTYKESTTLHFARTPGVRGVDQLARGLQPGTSCRPKGPDATPE